MFFIYFSMYLWFLIIFIPSISVDLKNLRMRKSSLKRENRTVCGVTIWMKCVCTYTDIGMYSSVYIFLFVHILHLILSICLIFSVRMREWNWRPISSWVHEQHTNSGNNSDGKRSYVFSWVYDFYFYSSFLLYFKFRANHLCLPYAHVFEQKVQLRRVSICRYGWLKKDHKFFFQICKDHEFFSKKMKIR